MLLQGCHLPDNWEAHIWKICSLMGFAEYTLNL